MYTSSDAVSSNLHTPVSVVNKTAHSPILLVLKAIFSQEDHFEKQTAD